jgi:hypothetical protein
MRPTVLGGLGAFPTAHQGCDGFVLADAGVGAARAALMTASDTLDPGYSNHF